MESNRHSWKKAKENSNRLVEDAIKKRNEREKNQKCKNGEMLKELNEKRRKKIREDLESE